MTIKAKCKIWKLPCKRIMVYQCEYCGMIKHTAKEMYVHMKLRHNRQ